MRSLRTGACLLALAFCRTSDAAITNVSSLIVDNSAAASLSGYVTQDIVVTGTGQLTSVELLLDAGADNIYQSAVGNNLAPNAVFFPTFPDLEFDTFVGLGGRVAGTGFAPSVAGGAVDIGGAGAATFTDAKIDMTWFPPGGDFIHDPTDYFVARLSLKNDFNGSLHFAAYAGGESYTVMDSTVINGVIDFGHCHGPHLGDIYIGPGANLSEGLQGAFDTRNGGPIVLASAIVLGSGGDPSSLGDISTMLVFGAGVGDTFATGEVTDDDGDGKYDIMIDADWSSLPMGQLLSGEVLVTADFGCGLGLIGVDFAISVPEPSAIALSCLALIGLACRRYHSLAIQ